MSRTATPGLPLHNGSPRSPPGSLQKDRLSPKPPTDEPTQSITSTYARLSPGDTATRLSTSLTHGLSASDAEIRLNTQGPNELPHDEPEPLWLRFLKQFKETLILLLLGSALVSFIMGNLEDALSISAAVTIVVTVGFVQEYRSEKSLEALNRLVPHYAHLIRAGGSSAAREGGASGDASHTVVSASQLVPGDLVSFFTGDRIPADVRITHETDLTIDESNLTGENEPVSKTSDTLQISAGGRKSEDHSYASDATGIVGADLRLNEQTNIGFMGTLVRSGYGHGIVIGTGGNTEFGAVSRSLGEIESPRTPLQMSMDRLGKDLSYMSFGVIGVIMLVGLWRGWQFLEMFQTGVSLAVAAIPEGLPIIVTVTLALGVFRMSKRHAIVKRLPSVETLGSVNVICTDKTGTLTTNHMTVTKLWHFDTPQPFEAAQFQKSHDLDAATRILLRVGNVANNARLAAHANGQPATASSSAIWASTSGDDSSAEKSRWLGQPTDVAMLDLVDLLGEHDVRESIGSRRQETPFSSERKWMGVVIQGSSEGSEVAYIKGAIEQVLKKCDTYTTKDGREVILDDAGRTRITQAADSMAKEGLRVLGMAKGAVGQSKSKSQAVRSATAQSGTSNTSTQADDKLFQGLAFSGLAGMSDPPRKGVDKAIRRLMAGGVKVIMITGDAETTAVAIGKKLGMPINLNTAIGKAVIRGDELDKMSEEDLAQAIATTTVFARTSPDHKLKIVRALQQRGDVVAMTGDGVNDAPALKKADIGVAMGRLGTDVAKEAADMILTDDDFSTILSAIEEGKGIFSNIQNFLTFQLSTSAAALSLVFFSTFLGFPNPLNAMQILWINILMDGPPAQSLGVEPVDPAVMSRPPRSKQARVLTRALLQRVLQSASIIMIGTMLVYIHEMSDGRIVNARDTTMTFTCFVLFDMFNALSCRSEGKSVLLGEVRLFSNKMFNYAVGLSLIGQAMVIYLPLLQRVFQTEALGFFDLVRLVMTASCVFWADEVRKFVKRKGVSRGMSGYSSSV